MEAPGTPKSRYQRLKERDPAKPKRPSSAFFQFNAEQRPAVSAELGAQATQKNVCALLAERWKALPQAQKEVYQARFLKEKKVWEKDMKEYKASGAEADFQAKRKAEGHAAAAPSTPVVSGRGLKSGSAASGQASTPSGAAAASRGSAGVDLSRVPTTSLVLELAQRHGWPVVAATPSAPASATASGAVGAAIEAAPSPPKRRRKAPGDAPAASVPPPPAPPVLPRAAGLVEPLEGLAAWLTRKRRARVREELGTDDEEELMDEATLRFAALDEEVREKYRQRAREAAGGE